MAKAIDVCIAVRSTISRSKQVDVKIFRPRQFSRLNTILLSEPEFLRLQSGAYICYS